MPLKHWMTFIVMQHDTILFSLIVTLPTHQVWKKLGHSHPCTREHFRFVCWSFCHRLPLLNKSFKKSYKVISHALRSLLPLLVSGFWLAQRYFPKEQTCDPNYFPEVQGVFDFYSILGCVLPLQEVALHQSSNFSVLVYTAPYCPLVSSLQWCFSLQTYLTPSSATLCFLWSIYRHSFRWCVQSISIWCWLRIQCIQHFRLAKLFSKSVWIAHDWFSNPTKWWFWQGQVPIQKCIWFSTDPHYVHKHK